MAIATSMRGEPAVILDKTRLLLLQAAFGEGEQAVAAYRSWRGRFAFRDIDLSAFRVLAQLARTAGRLELEDPDVGRIRGALKQTWTSNMLRARALAAAIAAIDRAGIGALVVHGAALFARFPHLGKVHVADDFDILVRERDMIEAMKSLASAGFRLPVQLPLDSFRSDDFTKVRASVTVDGAPGGSIDLHAWPLPGWPREGFMDELFAGGESRLVAGQQVRIPALAEHLCLALAVADGREQDEVFAGMVEVMHILRESKDALDWSRFVWLCRRFHRGPAALAILSWIRSEIGISVPDMVLEQLRFLDGEARGAAVDLMRVLHVMPQLRRGGPLQMLIAAKKQSRLKSRVEHHIVSLKAADRRACEQAAKAEVGVTSAPDAEALRSLLAEADIVQAHFWNSPDTHAFLTGDLPPVRLLLWCHVNGAAAPHVIPARLIDRSDMVVVQAASTLNLPAFRAVDPAKVAHVESLADFTRVADLDPAMHDGFHVGYIGTVNFAKLHSSFMPMCAAVKVPAARFLICGDGGGEAQLRQQALELGIAGRCEFHDHAEDIRPILRQLDVFGYPLTSGTSATAELALQEAMYAGICPVVFAHGGLEQIVGNARTGIVVQSESEYSAAIEWLYRNPDERKRLGENAAREMRELLRRNGGQADAVYLRLMQGPKHPHCRIEFETREARVPPAADSRGAWSFIHSLDGVDDSNFITSVTEKGDARAEAAEAAIGLATADVQDVVLHYRLRYPKDPHLRLWAGVILGKRGRHALASSEFRASIALGCESPRVLRYFQLARGMSKRGH